jgi:prepilin-type processing-associated H-X9-DG protein
MFGFTIPTNRDGVPCIGLNQDGSSLYQILPFVEQENLWRQSAQVVCGTALPLYFCPSRRPPLVGSPWNYASEFLTPLPRGLNDYAGCSLASGVGAVRPNFFGGPVRLTGVTDGASRTLMFSEKSLFPDLYGGISAGDNEGFAVGGDDDTQRECTGLPPVPDVLSPSDGGTSSFGSAHPNGLNVGFCDGAVRPVSYSVDVFVWTALGTRAGREVFDMPD